MRHLPVVLAIAVAACTPDAVDPPGTTDDPYDVAIGPYDADITWTTHGVPHIEASNVGSGGFAMGYAFARDHGCVLADQVVKVRGERAFYFGADPVFVDSDFGWLALGPVATAEDLWADLSDQVREAFVGYAAGYNLWVDEGDLPPACAGEPWVKPVTHIDLLAYTVALAMDGSGAVWVDAVGRAQPPGGVSAPPPPKGLDELARIGRALRDPKRGSNGWAIGRDRTETGRGMLLSNTHFPAVGEKQWHEVQLTIPGEVDVYGASLMGVPLVNIGFNEHVAWTHTVSYAPRFIGYFLTLDPNDPTRYAYDGGWKQMEPTTYEIEVADGQGGYDRLERTLWRSDYGPIIDAPIVGWSNTLAITYRDVNTATPGLFDVWWRMDRAASLDELIEAQTETQGIPWVYTMATDTEGEVFFGDLSRVPYLSDEAVAAWQGSLSGGPTAVIASLFADFGVIGVDGGDPLYAWKDDPRAVTAGVVPPELAPTDRRTDYVFNANDSYWLHNAEHPLEGFNQALYGAERTARSARTRMNGRMLSPTDPGQASGADGLFSAEEVEGAALSFRSVITEEALADVVERCTGVTDVVLRVDTTVDVTQGCATLAAWDGRFTVDAHGAVLWRELVGSGQFDVQAVNDDGGGLFTTPFDPTDPLGTPRDVVTTPDTDPPTENDPVLRALATALQTLDEAGLAVDVRLGDVQFMSFGDPADDTRIGVPGAGYWEGTIGVADYSGSATTTLLPRYVRPGPVDEITELTPDGYPINNGNSYILVVSYTDDGPSARAVMTYSQSEDWRSPFLDDQTPIYAEGSLRPVAFTPEQVADAAIERLSVSLAGP